MSLKHRALARFSVSSSLVVTLCAAAVLTSVGNEGLLLAARSEAAKAAQFEHSTGDPAVELLQSLEFAGFVTGRDGFAPFAARAAETDVDAAIPWLLGCAAHGRSPALSGQQLHSLYCVWIV